MQVVFNTVFFMIVIFVNHRQQPSGASGGCGAAPGSACSRFSGLPRAFVVVSFVLLRRVPAGPSGRSDLSRQLPRCSLPTRRLVLLGPKKRAATSRGFRKPFVCHRFCLSLWRGAGPCGWGPGLPTSQRLLQERRCWRFCAAGDSARASLPLNSPFRIHFNLFQTRSEFLCFEHESVWSKYPLTSAWKRCLMLFQMHSRSLDGPVSFSWSFVCLCSSVGFRGDFPVAPCRKSLDCVLSSSFYFRAIPITG